MPEPKIRLEGVTKVFRSRFQTITAVENTDMQFQQGDFVTIIGPSGCGKSTIIRMIADIIKPTSGSIFIDGENISVYKRIPVEVIRKLGFVFQLPNMFPWRTVRENVMLPLDVFKLRNKESEEYADELIEMAGLTESKDAYPVDISGGSMQRAGVIRAMVHKPEILLMDEPFGSLDQMMREQLNLELLDIWEDTNKTIIFITHSVDEAVLLSNSVYVMGTNPGRVIDRVSIDIDRPRDLSVVTTPEFIDYCAYLTDKIGRVELDRIK